MRVFSLGFVASGLPIGWPKLDKWHLAKNHWVILLPLFGAELKPRGHYLEHVFYLDHVILTNMSHVYYLDQ